MSVFHHQQFCKLTEERVQDSFRFQLNINMGLITWVCGWAVIIDNNPEKAEIAGVMDQTLECSNRTNL